MEKRRVRRGVEEAETRRDERGTELGHGVVGGGSRQRIGLGMVERGWRQCDEQQVLADCTKIERDLHWDDVG